MTGANDVDDVVVKSEGGVERRSEQFNVVSELHASSCDTDALCAVDLRQPPTCAKNHSFGLGNMTDA